MGVAAIIYEAVESFIAKCEAEADLEKKIISSDAAKWWQRDRSPIRVPQRRQLFPRSRNETLSVVAMRANNPDCSPFAIHGCDAAPTPTGFAEVISDYAIPNCRTTRSRHEFVDAPVVVVASMYRGAVKVSKCIHNHPIVRKGAIRRTLEGMNYSLGPLTAGQRP